MTGGKTGLIGYGDKQSHMGKFYEKQSTIQYLWLYMAMNVCYIDAFYFS